jgi:hypothetical protein
MCGLALRSRADGTLLQGGEQEIEFAHKVIPRMVPDIS